MGGFCVLRGPAPALMDRCLRAEREALVLDIPRPVWLDLPGGRVGYWPKRLAGDAQLWRGPGPDFALAAGTFIFDDLAGPRALAAFHAVAGDRPEALLPRTLGQFTLVLRRGDRAWLLHDQVGFHQLFRAPDDTILSTSFLLAARLLDRVSVDPQGLLEYVFSGVPLGDATPLAELRLLGKDSFLELDAAGCCERYTPPDLPDEIWPAALALPRFAWIVVAVAGVGGRRAEPHRTGHERTLPPAGLQHRADHARRPGLPPHRRARHETRRPLPGLRGREPGRPQSLPPAPGRPALARASGRGRAGGAPVLLPQGGLPPTDLRRAPA